MLKSLNSDALNIVATLYDSKAAFREGLDRLLHEEIRNAMDFNDRINKLMADGEGEVAQDKPVKAAKNTKKSSGTGKRGRPPGSKNKPKAEAPGAGDTVTSDAGASESVETKVTHGHAIAEILKGSPDGLTAGELLEALSKSSIEGYSAPSKGTLQTTLVGLRDKKVIKAKGKRPNTKYFIK